jgi:ABC-type transporter Mla subunit MlaD
MQFLGRSDVKIDEKFLSQDLIRTTKTASKIGGLDFSETLAKANQKDGSVAGSDSKTSGVSEVLETSSVGRILAVAATGRTRAVEQLDRTLEALDKYADALADPTKTLKDLTPLVEELETTATRLDQAGRELPAGDELRSMMDETAILASVEAARFNRGDYV